MPYDEVFRSACESLGEGYYEIVKGLLAPHLGRDPFSVALEDPRKFYQTLKMTLGSEADMLIASLSATLKERGARVDRKSLERAFESGDRERVRDIFAAAGLGPLEVEYRDFLIKQFDALRSSRKRRVALSSVLLGLATFLLVYLMAEVLREYISSFFNGMLVLGSLAALSLAIHNYLINIPSVPRAGLRVRLRVQNPSALNKSRLPELIQALGNESGSVSLDLAELSRSSAVPLADLVNEVMRLQREGVVRVEFMK